MKFDCLGAPDLFCVACDVTPSTIHAEIVWSRGDVAGEQRELRIPKQLDSEIYSVIVPDDLATLHTEVIFHRVSTPLENKNGSSNN
jgi:hypothetical protein